MSSSVMPPKKNESVRLTVELTSDRYFLVKMVYRLNVSAARSAMPTEAR